jgi:hypothetical protein
MPDLTALLPILRDVGFPVFVATFCLLRIDGALKGIDRTLSGILEELRK